MGNLFGNRQPKTTVTYGVCSPRIYRYDYPIYIPAPDRSTENTDTSRTTDPLADRFSTAVTLNKNVTKKTPKRQSSDCEEFLLSVLNWDPAWLSQEQKGSPGTKGTSPCVVNANSISEIPSKFRSHENYCEVMETLLALEFWDQILREVETTKETTNPIRTEKKLQAPIPCALVSSCSRGTTKNTAGRIYARGGTLNIESIISRKNSNLKNYPVSGDLILVRQNHTLLREKRLEVFAYVEEIDSTRITTTTRYNRSLTRYVREPHTLLTYTVLVKSSHPGQHFCSTEIYTLQKIFYLRSNLRMIEALRHLPRSPLFGQILHPKFEDLKLSKIPSSKPRSLVTKDELNVKQLEAIVHVTDTVTRGLTKICLIQGPPGTGKSKVIVNLVTEILDGKAQFISKSGGMRILICAPSNTAVDEVVRRLLDVCKTLHESRRFKMIRMGQMESMNSQVAKEVSMPALVKKALDGATDACDACEAKKRSLIAEIKKLEEAQQANNGSADANLAAKILQKHSELDCVIQQMRALWKEIAERKKKAEILVLTEANVIACTLNSCYSNLMESTFGIEDGPRATFCIVDEATQCVEADCLIPLMLGVRTLVLVGDTNQLPATVISQRAKALGLDQSLFARVQKCFPTKEENPVIQLDTQYRMPPPVALWPNRFFYDGLLQNAAIVQDLPFRHYKVLDHNASQNKDKFSNTDEAAFVVNLLVTLMTYYQSNGAKTPFKVGIITPYNNQKTLIHKQMRKCIDPLPENTRSKMHCEVNTVDSFQGQERDVIIMSCVRSNGIGFLSDRHRLCVALTRAKHTVILCGNFKTFERNSMWRALLSDAKTRGAYLKIEANARPDEMKQHIFR